MKRPSFCLLPVLFLASSAVTWAQYATEATASLINGNLIQGNANQLSKMIESIDKLKEANSLLTGANEVRNQMKDIMGLPQQALSKIGTLQNLNLGSIQGAEQSLKQLAQSASGQNALSSTGDGLYKSIASSVNGVSVTRDLEGYKKFDAFDKTFEAYAKASDDIATKLSDLNQQLTQTQNQPAQTEAEQREKQAKIASLQGQIQTLQAKQQQMAADVAARKAANDQDKEKQDKAAKENLEAAEKEAVNVEDPLAE